MMAQARAGLIIPPDYGDRLASGSGATVAFIIDGSDPAIAGTALSAAQLIGQAKSTALVVERASPTRAGRSDAVTGRSAHTGVVQP